MEFDEITTAITFVIVVALGSGLMLASDMMATDTVLTMVVPSMVVFGLVMVGIGVKFGQYRAS